ncbi:MAG: thymidine kinase [Bacilli bacterium]|nr:thymidine kinase [Bacilli bacterium]MBQ8218727.1 thymidine kinase [Bacilli bacterium]
MAKISFRYGAMGSSKTANLLMIKYNFEEKNKKVILLKPKLENRDGKTIIKSRIGLESECIYVEDFLDNIQNCDCILIDEAQFLTEDQVNQFVNIADNLDIPIIAFGLKTDFTNKLFEGSKRLIEVADDLQEITTICWCGKKARCNARIINGKVIKDGDQIQLGGNESYISLCRLHYNHGQLSD